MAYLFFHLDRPTFYAWFFLTVFGCVSSLLNIICVVKRPQCILIHPSGVRLRSDGWRETWLTLFWSDVRYFDLGDRQSFVSFSENGKARSVELPFKELTIEDQAQVLEEIKRYWPDADAPWQDQLAARS
jgi:hypothetical protein